MSTPTDLEKLETYALIEAATSAVWATFSMQEGDCMTSADAREIAIAVLDAAGVFVDPEETKPK